MPTSLLRTLFFGLSFPLYRTMLSGMSEFPTYHRFIQLHFFKNIANMSVIVDQPLPKNRPSYLASIKMQNPFQLNPVDDLLFNKDCGQPFDLIPVLFNQFFGFFPGLLKPLPDPRLDGG